MNPVNDKISVNSTNGEIMVATGLGVEEYAFQVEVSINDIKLTTSEQKPTIYPRAIRPADFTIPPSVTKSLDYMNTDYGTITANGEVAAIFSIVDSNAPNNEITINKTTGAITVAAGLGKGIYSFKVEITGTGDYTSDFITDELKFSVTDNLTGFTLKNVFNVAANLVSPQSITSTRVG